MTGVTRSLHDGRLLAAHMVNGTVIAEDALIAEAGPQFSCSRAWAIVSRYGATVIPKINAAISSRHRHRLPVLECTTQVLVVAAFGWSSLHSSSSFERSGNPSATPHSRSGQETMPTPSSR